MRIESEVRRQWSYLGMSVIGHSDTPSELSGHTLLAVTLKLLNTHLNSEVTQYVRGYKTKNGKIS